MGPREIDAASMEQVQLFGRRLEQEVKGEKTTAETSEQLSLLDRLGPGGDTLCSLNTGKRKREIFTAVPVDSVILKNIEVLLSERFSIPAKVFVRAYNYRFAASETLTVNGGEMKSFLERVEEAGSCVLKYQSGSKMMVVASTKAVYRGSASRLSSSSSRPTGCLERQPKRPGGFSHLDHCVKFQRGRCTSTAACPFRKRHELVVCRWNGRCHHGDSCWYHHTPVVVLRP